MKLKNIDLKIVKEALERVGKRELKEDALLQFAAETVKHEIGGLNHRTLMWENDEIDEDQINEFDLYNEKDYRTGILHEFDQDNLLTLEREKDEESGEIVEIKAKTVGEDGKLVRIVLITRLGWITMFLSTNWFNTINDASDKSTAFIFVGSLSTKYKNLTTGEYDKVKDEEDEYAEFNNYTFNLWQLVQLVKTKDGSAELIMIEKQEEEV